MKIGIFGTGMVGTNLGTRLQQLGHDVMLGGREPDNAAAAAWADGSGGRAGTFAQTAEHGEILVNATLGVASVAAIGRAAEQDLEGKVLLDTAIPLDFSGGFPPSLNPVNTDSLGEQIQAAFPQLRVVKTLNTVLAHIMVDPGSLPAPHDVFVAGEDPTAKQEATALLVELGWPPEHILDLGGIRSSRATEMYMVLWLALDGVLGTGNFNICVVRS